MPCWPVILFNMLHYSPHCKEVVPTQYYSVWWRLKWWKVTFCDALEKCSKLKGNQELLNIFYKTQHLLCPCSYSSHILASHKRNHLWLIVNTTLKKKNWTIKHQKAVLFTSIVFSHREAQGRRTQQYWYCFCLKCCYFIPFWKGFGINLIFKDIILKYYLSWLLVF